MTDPPGRDTGESAALFLVPDLEAGGAERFFVTLVNGIETPRPIPVALRRGPVQAGVLRDDRPLQVVSGPARTASPWFKWFSGPVGLWRRTRAVLDLLTDTGASAIVSIRHRAHVVALCARVATRGRVPVVLGAHETLSQELLFEHGFVGRAWYEWFAYRFFRQADLIVAASEGIAEDLVEKWGVPRERIDVLPRPVDAEALRALSRQPPRPTAVAPPGASVILGVGRLTRSKGFDVLVRALSRVAAHANAHLVLLGDGPEGTRLDGLAESLGVADRLHRPGFVQNPWAHMRRADVLAVPFRAAGLPEVINEAHAVGIPVVASHCSSSVGEALGQGESGVLVHPEDPAALANALIRILEDGALAARLIRSGRSRIASLDPAAAVDRFADLVEGVVARSARAADSRLDRAAAD